MNKIFQHDVLNTPWPIESGTVNTCVTSPPYWGLRDYGNEKQIGLETAPGEYVENIVKVFQEVRRVLKDDGTVWLNLGDSYTSGNRPDRDKSLISRNSGLTNQSAGMERANTPAGLKPKDLIGIPWRVAFALQADGWYLRQDIIWHKPNPMPESVTDRCTKSHEYIFLLSKSQKYYYDNEAIKEDSKPESKERYNYSFANKTEKYTERVKSGCNNMGTDGNHDFNEKRNKRSVWTVNTQSYKGAHFAVFPHKLILPCIKAGCPEGGIVLDPFMGSGTTAKVAIENQCNYIGLEINPEYIKLAEDRLAQRLLF